MAANRAVPVIWSMSWDTNRISEKKHIRAGTDPNADDNTMKNSMQIWGISGNFWGIPYFFFVWGFSLYPDE